MKYHNEITIANIKQDFILLKILKDEITKQLYKSALRGSEYITIPALTMLINETKEKEECIKDIITEFSLGKVELTINGGNKLYYVLTDPEIWKRAREIDEYINDNKLKFFRSGYLEIEKKTKYDKDILESKLLDVSEEDGTLTISVNKAYLN